MDDIDKYISIIERVGLPWAIIIIVLWWLKPRAEKWFSSQDNMMVSVCQRLDAEPAENKQTRRAIHHVGKMVHASADADRREKMEPHMEALRREVGE